MAPVDGSTSTAVETASPPISGLVPMIHVADVERSAEFYGLLGFVIGNSVPAEPPMHWAWLYAPKASDWKRGPNLMVTRSARPLDPSAQDVLFYLYAADLPSLRSTLVSQGIEAGEIDYPEYLPNGEFRVQDPDGYTLMIAQSTTDTP
jgi:catechol 2,3-dioxygenase-like lactoylglutathione lyase family enzyme